MAGTASAVWALNPAVVEHSKELAEQLGCPTVASAALMKCVRNKTNAEINSVVMKMGQDFNRLAFLRFTPVIDGDFLPAPVSTMRQSAPKKSTIVGMAEMEGISFGKISPGRKLRGEVGHEPPILSANWTIDGRLPTVRPPFKWANGSVHSRLY